MHVIDIVQTHCKYALVGLQQVKKSTSHCAMVLLQTYAIWAIEAIEGLYFSVIQCGFEVVLKCMAVTLFVLFHCTF